MMMAIAATAQSWAPTTISLTDEERAFVTNNNDFAFNMFRRARDHESMLLSPLSITYALGMLNNGATGETQREINEVLGCSDISVVNTFCQKLLAGTATLDSKTKVMIANNIYFNESHGLQLAPSFVEKAATFYGATPEVFSFNEDTRNIINQWASEKTEGMIPEVLHENEFDTNALSYLLNALYFKSKWSDVFDVRNTEPDDFLNESGTRQTVMMMDQTSWFNYTENSVYQSVILPYGNGAYQMTIFLPLRDKSVSDVLEYIDGHDWNGDDYMEKKVWLRMPRFETKTDMNLIDLMKSLGMQRAFDKQTAQFDSLCDYLPDSDNIYVNLMKQAAKVKVTEDGTEAAAVTVIGVGLLGSVPGCEYEDPVPFFADHPYLYVISEKSTGAILFMGQYMGDSVNTIDNEHLTCRSAIDTNVYDIQGRKIDGTRPMQKGLYISRGRKFFKK
jgi:serpin B